MDLLILKTMLNTIRRFFRNHKGIGRGIINTVVLGSIGLTVLYILMSTIVLDKFNESYNTSVTGLSASTTQGLLLLTLILALVGFGITYLPRIGGK